MDYIDSIGENIRLLRVKKGFSQEQLALNAGINTSYVGQIERGEKNPTIKILERISSALGITLLDLLTNAYSQKVHPSIECSQHPNPSILTPDILKQYILEILQDHTDIFQVKSNHKKEQE